MAVSVLPGAVPATLALQSDAPLSAVGLQLDDVALPLTEAALAELSVRLRVARGREYE